jgi:hypothetical protein
MHVVHHHVIYSPERNISSHKGLRYLHNIQLQYRGCIAYVYNVLTWLAADPAVS